VPHDSDGLPLLNLTDPHFRATNFATYAELRSRCPVAQVRFMPEQEAKEAGPGFMTEPAYLITRYNDSSEALLDDRIVVDHRNAMSEEQLAAVPEVPEEFRVFQQNILNIDPPDHTRLRKLVQPSFTNRQIEAMRPRIQAITDELLDRAVQAAEARGEFAPNRSIELIEQFAFPLPIRVISELLGIPADDQDDVERWFQALPINTGRPAESEEEDRATMRKLIDYLTELFARRRRAPTGDLISQLVHAEEDGDTLNQEELLAMVFILLTAGHVTTVNLIASGTFALLTHPDQLTMVKNDPEMVKNAVEEILRFRGPVEVSLPRFAAADVAIEGTTIPKGEMVLVGLASANHDPARFANPDEFDITREDANRHIAFGKGIHVCVGAPLARLEGQIALNTLFTRFPDMRLAVPESDVAWKTGFLQQLEALPILV
jgi:cytochrome P450